MPRERVRRGVWTAEMRIGQERSGDPRRDETSQEEKNLLKRGEEICDPSCRQEL